MPGACMRSCRLTCCPAYCQSPARNACDVFRADRPACKPSQPCAVASAAWLTLCRAAAGSMSDCGCSSRYRCSKGLHMAAVSPCPGRPVRRTRRRRCARHPPQMAQAGAGWSVGTSAWWAGVSARRAGGPACAGRWPRSRRASSPALPASPGPAARRASVTRRSGLPWQDACALQLLSCGGPCAPADRHATACLCCPVRCRRRHRTHRLCLLGVAPGEHAGGRPGAHVRGGVHHQVGHLQGVQDLRSRARRWDVRCRPTCSTDREPSSTWVNTACPNRQTPGMSSAVRLASPSARDCTLAKEVRRSGSGPSACSCSCSPQAPASAHWERPRRRAACNTVQAQSGHRRP